MNAQATVTPAKPAIPWWGYVFAVLCALIPIITLGGAIPGAIGAGGAFGCIAVSRQLTPAVPLRVLLCTGIAAACWVLFFVLVVAAAMLTQPS